MLLGMLVLDRKMSSFPKMGFQKIHFQMGGKARLGCMQLGSQGKACLVHLWMPLV